MAQHKRPNLLERTIASVLPGVALSRAKDRAQLGVVQNFSGLLGSQGPNDSGYGRHGASSRKKGLIGWLTSMGSADDDITANQPTLVERSRDLFMGSGLAAGAIKTIRTNVVGGGLRLKSAIDFDFLGLSMEEAGRWQASTEREFRLWADTTACDAYRRLNFGQLQSLVMLEMLHSGDTAAALPIIPRKGCPYDLRVRLISGDRICNPAGVAEAAGKDIQRGIEHDAMGEAVAAWVSRHHPNQSMVDNAWTRVPFYGRHGNPQLLLIAQDWERIGQRRGVPLLAPVIETLKQLSRYTDAELTACVVSAFFTVFVKSETPQAPLASTYDGSTPDTQPVAAADPHAYEMGSGSVVGLGPNEDITVANAGRANTAFEAFVMSICRQIGTGIELPYELLIKHFTASYSASRAALLEAWKMFKMRRAWLVSAFVQPVYEQWLAEAVAKGRIQAPGFFTDPAVRAAWCGAEWFGPTQGHLNPYQEARAAAVRVEEEFSTREAEAADATGMLWEDIHAARSREEGARRRDGTVKTAGDWGTAPVKAASTNIAPPPDDDAQDGERDA